MKTLAAVRLFLLVLLSTMVHFAFADEFVLQLDWGDGNPRATSHRERIAAVAHFIFSEDMREEIQQGDTLKVFFPGNWAATYLISEKRMVQKMASFRITETAYPGSFSVAPSGARRAGPPRGCLDPSVPDEEYRRNVLMVSGDSSVTGEMDRKMVHLLIVRSRCGE